MPSPHLVEAGFQRYTESGAYSSSVAMLGSVGARRAPFGVAPLPGSRG